MNKYRERTPHCRTPFLTRNHSDSVPAYTLTLASCFLYSLASKSIKCRGYPRPLLILNLPDEGEEERPRGSTKNHAHHLPLLRYRVVAHTLSGAHLISKLFYIDL